MFSSERLKYFFSLPDLGCHSPQNVKSDAKRCSDAYVTVTKTKKSREFTGDPETAYKMHDHLQNTILSILFLPVLRRRG